MDIKDVRKALWEAYRLADEVEGGVEGKSSEAYCEIMYPTYWECDTLEEFMQPTGLMVYSYALGPSRRHYFYYSQKEYQENYYTWYAPDPFKKAVEVINSWVEEYKEYMEK